MRLEKRRLQEHARSNLNCPSQFFPRSSRMPGWVLVAALVFSLMSDEARVCHAQGSNGAQGLRVKRVLMIFSEGRDLPGNMMMQQAVQAEMLAHSTNPVEFFTESLDASHFSNPSYYPQFENYLRDKYSGQNLDLVMAFMARDFSLADELPSSVVSNLPAVFVAVNELEVPGTLGRRPFTGIVQRYDIQGTIKFIFQLQPETRRVVVVSGVSRTDQIILDRIRKTAESVDGVKFEFWTNRPMAEMREAAASLPEDTVILLSPVQQRDVTGQPFYTLQIAEMLAPSASVPVYVLGAGLIGTGATGGSVVDFESLGTLAGRLAEKALAGTPVNQIPIEVRTNGTPMVDWRALKRWDIKQSRLPVNCVVRYRPHSMWEEHQALILFAGTVLLAQAITIAALLVQRRQRRRAEAEIQQQRTELTHVARVSTMGQLSSSLTHELNQPLGAILRNTEAAEIFLQNDRPNLEEVRAIMTDIHRDASRAGNVVDRMRTLFKRRSLVLSRLDLRDLVEDTVVLIQPDVEARQIKLSLQTSPHLPPVRGDRVHLQQVLLNLVLNGMDAMDAIPKSRRSLAVRIGEAENGNLQVAVSDCGTGIAPGDVAHIFEPFFTTKPNGMGMGLAISKTIIEAHGGNIRVDGNADGGTTATFTLPRWNPAKAEDGGLPASH
jgi:signal transduction histidine kinase